MRAVLKRNLPLLRPAQGDVFREVRVSLTGQVDIDDDGKLLGIDGTVVQLAYCIVLTQECDLEQDFNSRQSTAETQDKYLQTILVAPAYLAEKLRAGDHLESLAMKMQKINSTQWTQLKQNKNERYHFVPECIELNTPDMVIDFKHFYTIPRDYFYGDILSASYAASLTYLNRELMSQRFCNYLSRIGLPDDSEEINSHFSAMLSPIQVSGQSH